MRRLAAAPLLAVLGLAAPLAAQDGLFLTAGRVFAGAPDESSWRLTFQRDLVGPIGLDIALQELPGGRPDEGELYGFGVDFTLFEGSSRRLPALFLGAAGGVGLGEQDRLWYGASVGLRMPVVQAGPIRAGVEVRWRDLSVEGRDGLELGVTLGWRGRRSAAVAGGDATGLYVPRATTERLRATGIPEDKARLLGGVVSTALEEMGQPYVWGGTGDGSGGFDCSGLIYYAYGRYGVRIPRTAAGQATAGIAIRQDLDALLPGDILTFADRGEEVSHVGLYVGEGRFIHSASGGVRVSRLAEDDSYGKYWLRRWVGVRRIVE